jgi:hypothetical protein
MAREPEKSTRNTSKSKSETQAAKPAAGAEKEKQGADQTGTWELLKSQHQELQSVLAKRSETNADRSAIATEFAALWLPHQAIEEDVLLPAMKESGFDESRLVAGEIRKDLINILLTDLLQNDAEDSAEPRLEALEREMDTHVEAVQKDDEGMRSAIETAETQSPSLRSEIQTRYERMKQRFEDMDENLDEAVSMLAPRRLSLRSGRQQRRREGSMPRYGNVPDRDEQGRFMSDDEQRYSRGGSERDEYGRFMSEGGSRRSMGRERDDEGRFRSDNGPSRGRFQGDEQHYGPRSLGSMGRDRDNEGRFMSEGGSRSRGRYDEDDRYSRRSMDRDYDEDERYRSRGSGEGRGRGGWFGDSEGHAEASRRGWQRSSHGESGWYGDSEGHSRAARQGRDQSGGGEGPYGPRSRSGYADEGQQGGYQGYQGRRGGPAYNDDRRSPRGGGGRSGGERY